jgi:hypothetical protein
MKKMKIDYYFLESQLEKCGKCPCVVDEEDGFRRKGCIYCDNYRTKCADADCSTASIVNPDKLALCSADDCCRTFMMIRTMLKENEE